MLEVYNLYIKPMRDYICRNIDNLPTDRLC